MTPICTHIRITGLGAEKQLSHLQSQGHTLYDIRRTDLRTVEFACLKKQSASILSQLTERGFACDILPPRGAARKLELLKLRTPFLIFMLCALFALSYSLRFIWRIDIIGAGAYMGEIRTYLRENAISPSTPMRSLSLKSISADLTHRLPRVAWVHVSYEGLALQISVTQGVPMPEIQTQGSNGHIIASRDGVIESLHVYAGTAAVRSGDTVKAGDVLIYGHERSANDTIIPVRARGKVTARTYISACASVTATTLQTLRTGNCNTELLLHSPLFDIPLSPSSSYLSSEYESSFLPLGGAWFPLKLERRTVYEVYFSQETPDETALKAEVSRLCLQNLLSNCAENDEIIDKWLYYSMIEGGILSATVTAEVRADIGIFSPETPE